MMERMMPKREREKGRPEDNEEDKRWMMEDDWDNGTQDDGGSEGCCPRIIMSEGAG